MFFRNVTLGCIGVAALMFSTVGRAVPITSEAELVGTTQLIDFDPFVGSNQFMGVEGPVEIGADVGQSITASSGTAALYLFNGNWALINNGTWTSTHQGFLGVWPNGGPVRITFNQSLVSGFGGYMNYVEGPGYDELPITIRAFDVTGALLEEFGVSANAPIDTTADSMELGAFRGIQRATADIRYIELEGFGIVYDDLKFASVPYTPPVSPVPEGGATAGMLAAVAAGILVWRGRGGVRRYPADPA